MPAKKRQDDDLDDLDEDEEGEDGEDEEDGEDAASDAIDDRIQYAAEMAREQMLSHAIQSIAETMGADMSELVHALCSTMAGCCVEAARHVTNHEQTIGTILTHKERVDNIMAEVLEKIGYIEKEQLDAARPDKDSTGEGTSGKSASSKTEARTRRRLGTH